MSAAGNLDIVGKPRGRIDGFERVTGQAKYSWDVRVAGSLFARVLRSPWPHARIVAIDTAAAEALPGVKAVIHAFNTQVPWSSGETVNKRFMFNNPVRYVGDAVAAVAATDRYIAEDALELIKVTYEKLPYVLDMEETLAPEAPKIWPDGNLAGGKPMVTEWGDVDKAFQQADLVVVEGSFASKHINNGQMEPRSSTAVWNGDQLTVYTPTQGISNAKRDLAVNLKISQSKVRVICQYMGGGFGNKNQAQDADLMAAVLAQRTGKPVRVEFTRADDWIGVHGRWATRNKVKVAAKRDGTLVALDQTIYSNQGAYKKSSGSVVGLELWDLPNVRRKIYPTYTNTITAANFRAPAYPQGIFATGQIMDMLAEKLGMNPLDFVLKNFVKKWNNKQDFTSTALEQTITTGAERFHWRDRWHKPGDSAGPRKSGIGMTMGNYPSAPGLSGAILRLNPDASVQVVTGVTDIGGGAKTTMAMIGAEALGVPWETVSALYGDTFTSPYSVGESSSRNTMQTGTAVVAAAKQLREQIFKLAAPELGNAEAGSLDMRQGQIFAKDKPATKVPLEKIAKGLPDAIQAAATTNPKVEQMVMAFATHFAEVEVDVETGKVRVLDYVAIHDSGQIVNPLTAESQIQGGIVQGISMALGEELLTDPRSGIPLTYGYHDQKVFTHLDVPNISVTFVGDPDPVGPLGAKALGETPITAVVGTLANAVYNATGTRFTDLPITPDKILDALYPTQKGS